MKKVLILNLANDTEILSSAYFIAGLHKSEANLAVTMVVYDDYKALASKMNKTKVVTINRNAITKYTNSNFTSDSYALNQFAKDIEVLISTTWDKVINFSNDNVSAYLANIIPTKIFAGSIITNNGTVKTTNAASTYFNFAYPNTKGEININDVKMNFVNARSVEGNAHGLINVDQEISKYAAENLNKINSRFQLSKQGISIVGLVVSADSHLKQDDYLQVVRGIIESQKCFPLLISVSQSESKLIINYLNSYFNNELISVSTTLENFGELCSNLSLVISSDVNYAVVADLTATPNVYLTGNINTKTLTYFDNSITLEYDINNVTSDLAVLISKLSTGELNTTLELRSKCFINAHDSYGCTRMAISNNYIVGSEVFNFSRNYYLNIFTRTNATSFNLPNDFVSQIKTEVSTLTRYMLATLRSLKTAQANGQSEAFMRSLESLLRISGELDLLSVPVKLFEGKIENLTESEPSSIYTKIEEALFGLKENVKLCTNLTSTSINQSSKTQNKEVGV